MTSVRTIGSGTTLGVPDQPRRGRRGARTVPSGEGHAIPRNTHIGALPRMRIAWRDGSTAGPYGQPVVRPLSAGPDESRVQALEAASHLRRIDAIVRQRWNRAGWDDRGGDLTVVVNQKGMGGNAYFATTPDHRGEMGIGVSDARIGFRRSPAYSPSILFHEYVHGIVDTELRDAGPRVQPYLAQREHRAINESIADVLSTGLLGTGWRNGHEIRNGAPLRDLANPAVPRWNASVRSDTGLEEHTLSGIVSRAAVVAAETAGTLPVVDAWYAAIDVHYARELRSVERPGAGRALGAWVRATMRGAEQVGGRDGALVEAIRDGWEAVGLGRYASAAQLAASAPPRRPARRGREGG